MGPGALPHPSMPGKEVSVNAAPPVNSAGPLRRTGPNHHFIQRAGSRRLVIYFSGTGKDQGKFDFWKVGRKIPENVLFVSDARNHWYQSGIVGLGSTIDLAARRIRKWGRAVGIDEYVTVGASMGGFGAIAFACKLGGRALVFGSDTILRLPLSRSLKQMPSDAPTPLPDMAPLIAATSTKVQLYAGEMDVMDVVGAQRIAHLPTVSIQTLSGATHKIVRYFYSDVGLVETINAFVREMPLPTVPDIGTIMDHPEAIRLYYEASLAAENEDWLTVGILCDQGLVMTPSNLALRFLLGKSHLKTSNAAEALRHLEIVARSVPHFDEGQVQLGIALQRVGEVTKSLETLREATIRWPDSDRAHYHLALVSEKAGESELAISSIRAAVRLKPRSPLYRNRLREMEEEQAKTGLARIVWPYVLGVRRLIGRRVA